MGVTYDEAVNISRSKGLEVIGIIVSTPDWALPPGAPPGENHKWPPDEQYAQAFIDCCAEVASHFVGRIRYWEFWNEPNGMGWHSYDPAEYTTWLIRAYHGIKAGNANVLVSVGGLDGGDTNFLNGIRANGGQNYYDAVAIHPYPSPRDQPIDTTAIDNVRQNMVDNGDGAKSIWVTEYGWKVGAGQGEVDEATQADRVQNALIELRFGGRYYVTAATYLCVADFPIDNVTQQWGLCDSSLNRRPAFYRFQAMAPYWEVRAPVRSVP